ncbi:MAG: 3-deoxy-D-manno-octulosonic acid transferase [Marinicaulis sp.]|nr:3-deoxy-D-manno-octulosonic acid transferase [Marinicaulis sp.]NNE40310.1 3-deoxy-D-manno-octulosonic acid transferase [Marinicaulis sp.]NNL89887.1 3-deoxy-D-manno-octulosonic acid transferase [Marinicaulis sp.]
MTTKIHETLGLKIYRAVSRASKPVANFVLERRLKAGKEDGNRIDERRGVTGAARPDGIVVWVHGASVGESLSVLPLVQRLGELRSDINFLVTTGTVTSAKLMIERLPANAIHQYIPVDYPGYVDAFLEHWRPDAVFFIESEFWPNLIKKSRAATKFMALVNGRISPRSFEDWKRQPNSIRYLLSSFDMIIAQDNNNAERLAHLSGANVKMFGNLKHAAVALPACDNIVGELRNAMGDRQVWLAASTHPGEEATIIGAHKALQKTHPSIFTIIAPRHPERGAEIAALCEEAGLKVAQRSSSEPIAPKIDIYIADTLGELGIFYRLCDIAFVGGSLVEKGGHNPLEPARFGVAILHGPHIFNFAETYRDMRKPGGAALVRNDRELAAAIRRLMADQKTRSAVSTAAKDGAEESAERVLNAFCDALLTGIPATAKP